MIHYEIRQLIRYSNKSCELKPIYTYKEPCSAERLAIQQYDELLKEYPSEYFELVKITTDEECLKFTPIKD